MPYRSKAQARLFHARPDLRKFAPEFDVATDFSKLPAHVRRKRKRKHHGRSAIAEGLMRR